MSTLIFLLVLSPFVVESNFIGINCSFSNTLELKQCVEVKPKSLMACMVPIKGECENPCLCSIFKSSYEFPCTKQFKYVGCFFNLISMNL